ncbi:telomere repeats-binding bouquet formation protein 2 isoform X3 [Syngnathoides biaculeatus]|uniref:telomere repeats-binding bouquet formation protein 2 isoform X3 n=1 Tax=Syngnathoides biaculeatus TaxID=300417 RepID=UPI002ADE71A0|nr:telomere repeats-binding bouquet formation protein 2 isoform X3 [Syngnathoides biaculeatus]
MTKMQLYTGWSSVMGMMNNHIIIHIQSVEEEGIVTGWRTADYLFSDDAAHPDTLWIFQSKVYLWDKITVFHSLFLCVCKKRQSVKSVRIGHYVLPPVPVQHVRNVVGRLIWEHDQPNTQSFADQAASNSKKEECSTDEFVTV